MEGSSEGALAPINLRYLILYLTGAGALAPSTSTRSTHAEPAGLGMGA